jgi:diaminohydroxyphosphoribosylaminopyrimidine deaminase/5-amino-6-(5-phosphoribosylamino)uracil reductase
MTASSGASQWITGPRARRYAHVLRASCDVIVTSARVVIDDDAQMTARNVVQKRAAARVILDSDGSLLREVAHRQASCRPTLRLLESLSHSQAGPVAVVLGLAATTDRAASRAAEHLTTLGVSIIDGTPWSRPASNTNSHWFDLASILNQLSSGAWWAKPEQQVSQIMFEAGPSMTSSLLQANLADEAWVFIAPKLLGGHGSKGPLELAAIDTPANAPPWRCILRKPCGDDQLLILRPDQPHQ